MSGPKKRTNGSKVPKKKSAPANPIPPSDPTNPHSHPDDCRCEAHGPVSGRSPSLSMNTVPDLNGFLTFIGLAVACAMAYYFRLHAVFIFGRVIHEFDPWFNFRATEYMVNNGIFKFFRWFDEMSWYPIGRHVGSTTYPGLLITSTLLYRFINFMGYPISVNDVCVFIPAIFGSLTTLFTALLTIEVTGSRSSGIFAGLIMAVIPAHLMRSVAGGYDNESVALTAIVSTFYFWILSIKDTKGSWKYSFICAASYIYMVSAWGGYTFVINMIGVHAGICLISNFVPRNLYASYSIFYLIGTYGATRFPMVRWAPLQSLEQILPLLVFTTLQILTLIEFIKKRTNFSLFTPPSSNPLVLAPSPSPFSFLFTPLPLAIIVQIPLVITLFFSGYFGPLSNRIKSLFIPHTKTGNPLVDSVSEHQATAPQYYWQYFHFAYFMTPIGLFFLLQQKITPAKLFIVLYTVIAYYFSQKMIRLLLLLSTPASILSGIFISEALRWCNAQLDKNSKNKSPKKVVTKKSKEEEGIVIPEEIKVYYPVFAAIGLALVMFLGLQFFAHSHTMAQYMSHPQILLMGKNDKGEPEIIEDFMQAYWWLRDYTPPDARIMAWWDYGYQINGISNRTTIADGNTWNHEHIALLGSALVSPEEEAWKIARHLADYVLTWTTRFAGIRGDDLAKMPHIANIAGSVYKHISRTGYYLDKEGKPSPLMKESLLYKLSVYRLVEEESEELKYFEEVYTSKNKMVRIYKIKDVAPRGPFGKYPMELQLGKFEE